MNYKFEDIDVEELLGNLYKGTMFQENILYKQARVVIEQLKPYYDAVRKAHNGYDSEAREVMPNLKEPETPEQAIQELVEESEELRQGLV